MEGYRTEMKRLIFCKSAGPNLPMPISQMVNKFGKYIYNNLDGSISVKQSSNTSTVLLMVLYQVPYLEQIPGKNDEGYNDMHEMHIQIDITTYANKVRINLTEITPDAKTIACLIWGPEQLQDMELAKNKILSKIQKVLVKEYSDYDFAF